MRAYRSHCLCHVRVSKIGDRVGGMNAAFGLRSGIFENLAPRCMIFVSVAPRVSEWIDDFRTA